MRIRSITYRAVRHKLTHHSFPQKARRFGNQIREEPEAVVICVVLFATLCVLAMGIYVAWNRVCIETKKQICSHCTSELLVGDVATCFSYEDYECDVCVRWEKLDK